MSEVNFQLACTTFLCNTVNFKTLRFGKVVNIIYYWAKFINCSH